MARRITTDSMSILMGALAIAFCVAAFPVVGQRARIALAQNVNDAPADTAKPVVVPETADDADEEDETLTAEERAAALQRRAGEQVNEDPRGRAVVLGMHVQETDRGHPLVVEVGPASPAFDAGIRAGDEIILFEGFRGRSYREWIDGMRKLVTDTPDGAIMRVDVLRDGKRVGVRIRAPEARALDPRVPGVLGRKTIEEGAGGQLPIQGAPSQPIAAGVDSDNEIFIGGVPEFGNEFDDAMSGAMERAMADIRRLSEPPQAAQRTLPQGSTVAPPDAPSSPQGDLTDGARLDVPSSPSREVATAVTIGKSAARIGLAGFRDNPDGLLVMIDVGGLAPGSYRVSIDDPSLAMGGAQPGPAGVTAPQRGQQPAIRQPVTQPVIDAPQTLPTGQVDPTAGTESSNVAQAAATRPAALPNAERAVGENQPGEQSPDQATGIRQREQLSRTVGGNAATLSEIGVLTIDQSGTGRLQQVVEGVQVRDVVGQAILIYPPVAPPETIVPPNAKVSDITGRRGAALQAGAGQRTSDAQTATAQRPAPGASRGAARPLPANEGEAAVQVAGKSAKPVAGGVIRLVSDRRPPDATPAATTDGAAQPAASERQEPQTQQPASRAGRAASQPTPDGRNPPR